MRSPNRPPRTAARGTAIALLGLTLVSGLGGSAAQASVAAGMTAAEQVIATIAVPANAQDAVVSADGTHAYVTSLEVGTVTSINMQTMQIDDSTSLGHEAGAIVRLGDGNVIVASYTVGSLDMVSTDPLSGRPTWYAPTPIAMASVAGDEIVLAVDKQGGNLAIVALTRDS